ncbi:FAD linked oxidase domain protein [Gordonia bronchialis DSM 43247]|uniref:Delta(24)-sterol reductase n=1 Tax=Gordonia bronchialis (strain ATCC 25592 / DSM 43247 / BCRC 13721 / JCM 3198 / KCTC 3076 / NBRC 16047 / NCTC 10667) TaxID=526226 RepID=D0LDE3_GORB4|nr:FAD-binding oxidoreductase [Gordonia bronchialis]ACY19763.1 FAD linked oxidase domain protein [Gordonia bronchialis DSM 43247]MCC3322537.1 FAD-binding oxidoreductase [Gordonia bronchialis]QGS27242.1 FAD-binding protein [Gordonia bronchialis]STQ62533.1 Probable decaprenylphosphoryl-beta-D-ribose oxidase [Gordonia bronchialis]
MGARAFDQGVSTLLESYRAIPPEATVRLAKKTSNLFRKRAANPHPGLDVSGLDRVISVDPDARTADVAGMCTYENLVAATLPYGLAPTVVPQLKTITLGGAVTGLGIESTSFRNGLPHEAVREIDILTGSGEIITATPEGEHSDLFFGFPNSYGTLGYSVRLKIELEQVPPYVELRHIRFRSLAELQSTMEAIVTDRSFDGQPVDYLDGVVFSADESYLTLGRQTAETGPTSDYTGMDIYYRSIQHKQNDRLTIGDYLWRWDTDWFWCSRAFGAQNPRIRRFWPKRYLRSSFYWKLIALDQRYDIGDRLNARKGEPPGERVVQDIEVPIENTTAYLEWFLQNIPIEPIWLCPLRLRDPALPGADPARPWPLYPLEPHRTYVNVGFWSAVPVTPGDPGHTNKMIEAKVAELDGHKSLYSESFYSPEDFDELYGGEHYRLLKKRYDPRGRLLDLYAKAVKRQ